MTYRSFPKRPRALRALAAALLALGLLPFPAAAQELVATAAEVCAASEDPCVVEDQLEIDDGAVLDFGTRAVEIGRGGRINVGAGTATILAGSFRARQTARTSNLRGTVPGVGRVGGSLTIQARGTCSNDAQVLCLSDDDCSGTCSGSGADITINNRVNATGLSGGTISLSAAGAIRLGGTISTNSTGDSNDGGSITATAANGNLDVTGRLSSRGGGTGKGGIIDLRAGGNATVEANVDVRGSEQDGGSVTIVAAGDIAIDRTIRASSRRGEGVGGNVYADAGGDLTVGPRARVRTNGLSTGVSPDRDGGFQKFAAGGDVSISGGARIESFGERPEAEPPTIVIGSIGHTLVNGNIRFGGRGGNGGLGALSITATGNVVTGPNSSITNRGRVAGSLDVTAEGIVSLTGSTSQRSNANGNFGATLRVNAGAGAILAGSVQMTAKGSFESGDNLEIESCTVSLIAGARVVLRGANGGAMLRGLSDVAIDSQASLVADPDTGSNSIELSTDASSPTLDGTVTPDANISTNSALSSARCSCGDAVVDSGEDCDDGNTDSGDGCDANCTVTACGNGITTAGEQCDDGAANSDAVADACRRDCTNASCGDDVVDTGETCDNGAGNSDSQANACRTNCELAGCGDGVVDSGETCDDGNMLSGDGCDANCTPTTCGNGEVTAGEDCDDGNNFSGDGCTAECVLEICGDGVVQAGIGEICDDSNMVSGDGCDENCTPTGCGNGVATDGEACDNGSDNSDTIPNACRADCTLPACGDSVLDSGEECDDGGLAPGDGCSPECLQEFCGDGVVQAELGETCDDGDRNSGDGCDSNCTPSGCGNTIVTSGEQCDDGNTAGGDGCAADCQCEPGVPCGATCSGMEFFMEMGSDLDAGWKGTGHNDPLLEGASIVALDVVRRCVSDNSICQVDSDCPGSACRLTCDCDGNDTECEISGPKGRRSCLADTSQVCTSDSDCSADGGRCVRFLGPPLPIVADGTPICVTTYVDGPIDGTADFVSGMAQASATIRARVQLGINIETPCPRCGVEVGVGDVRTCEGGPNDGLACVVDATSPLFGGVSSDCPPDRTANVSGAGLRIDLSEMTTGEVSRTAVLPCGAPSNFHPDNDNGLCLDNFATCDSNNDCNPGVSCGFYCHCGFCDDGNGPDPDRACFSDDDCGGDTCTSVANDSTLNQSQPNACESFICGEIADEECCSAEQPGCSVPTTKNGECNVTPAICATNSDCIIGGNGDECILTPRACFDDTISRSGEISPLGSYCLEDPDVGACTDDSDCGIGSCVPDSSEPSVTALFCAPASASSSINAALGIPGPGALTMKATVLTCRCGDGQIGCDEQCDDGNTVSGDGCDQACRIE